MSDLYSPETTQQIAGVPPKRPVRRLQRVAALLLLIIALSGGVFLLRARPHVEAERQMLAIDLLPPWPAPSVVGPRSGVVLRAGEGKARLAWADAAGTVYAMTNGEPAFPPLLGVNALAGPMLAVDMNSDGTEDLIFATRDHRLVAYSGTAGTRLAMADWFAEHYYMSPVACHTSDGQLLVFGHSVGGKFGLYRSRDLEVAVSEQYYDGRSLGAPVSVDVNSDGAADALAGTERGEVLWMDHQTGTLRAISVAQIARSQIPALASWQPRFRAPLSAFDYSGDGTADWVVVDGVGTIVVFDPTAREIRAWWTSGAGEARPSRLPPGPLVADLNLDGTPEIIVAHTDGTIYAFLTPRKVHGELKTLWTSETSGPLEFAPALADLNGDAIPELITVRAAGDLQVLDGATAEELYRAPLGVRGPPLLDDLDGDGLLEITAATERSWVVLKTNARVRGEAVWSQWRRNGSRLGVYDTPPLNAAIPWWQVGLLLAVVLGACGLWVKS
jgi:hypothetical protein